MERKNWFNYQQKFNQFIKSETWHQTNSDDKALATDFAKWLVKNKYFKNH